MPSEIIVHIPTVIFARFTGSGLGVCVKSVGGFTQNVNILETRVLNKKEYTL